jgi:putative DNA primase/helicase
MEVSLKPSLVAYYQVSRNAAYVALHPQLKNPIGTEWQKNPISAERALDQHENLQHNIGLINGEVSGIVDVDLDCSEAAQLASVFLPQPIAMFGHGGNNRGHWLFRCNNSGKTKQFNCPDTGATLVELRSNGSQTMIPPSVHPTGARLEFTSISDSAPSVDFVALQSAVGLLAASSFVAQNWKSGSRHNLSLGFSGLLLKTGVKADLIEEIVENICLLAQDEEFQDRINTVRTSARKQAHELAGYTMLEEILGDKAAKKISEWVGVSTAVYNDDLVIEPNESLPNLPRDFYENEITEAKMSRAFEQWAENKAMYVQENNQWYLWDGMTWLCDKARHINALEIQFLSEISMQCRESPYRGLEDSIRKFESLSKIKSVVVLAIPYLAKSISELDQNPMILALGNTYIDLKTGKPLQPDPNYLVSISSPVRFDSKADCPEFTRFLDAIFEGNEEVISFVNRIVGYCLTGLGDEQCMFIFNGDGANGKSTLVNILTKLLGQYASTAASHTLVSNTRTGVGDDLMHLVSSRLINVAETDRGQSLAESMIKRITGGDAITARALHGIYTTFVLQGKIVLTTNNLPHIQGRDHGIFRRLRVIPFARTFAPHEQDRTLGSKLEAELSGIMNWAIEGCLDWQKQGLNPPQVILDQLEHYQKDMDTIQKYVDAELVMQPEGKLNTSDLYANYRDWCRRMGCAVEDDRAFKSSMERIDGVSYGRNSKIRFWRGVAYRASYQSQGNEGVPF